MLVANFDNKLFQQERRYLNDSLEKIKVKSVGWRFQKLNYARYVNIIKQVPDALVLKVPLVHAWVTLRAVTQRFCQNLFPPSLEHLEYAENGLQEPKYGYIDRALCLVNSDLF